MTRVALIACTALLCACGDTDVQKAVRAELRDPESAAFETMISTGALECGTVNARNGYGGYAGPLWYLHLHGQTAVANDPPQSEAVHRCCLFLEAAAGRAPSGEPGFAAACAGVPDNLSYVKPI